MAVNGYTFDEISLPNPPTYVEGQPIDYVTVKLPTFLKSQYIALLDFISAVQAGFLITSDQVISLDADKITNNTQFTQSLFVGAESKIKLDGVNDQITITDSQGTPVTRVILGKLSGATNDYGVRVVDASGNIKFQTGSTTYIDGGIISANTVTATQIAADTITVDQMAANSVTAAEINVSNLSSVSADLGSCTAGTLTGGTIQTAASGARVNMTTDGINAYNASGTHVVDIANDGQFRFGPSGGSNITWNNSALVVNGSVITTGNITEGQVTGRATVTPNSELISIDDDSEGVTVGANQKFTVAETSVASLSLSCVGRDVLILFNPIFEMGDTAGTPPGGAEVSVKAVVRIRRDSATGTEIAQHYFEGSGLHGGSTIERSSSMVAFDAGSNVNGSLTSPATQTYHCTVRVEEFLVTTNSVSGNDQKLIIKGLGVACELRA